MTAEKTREKKFSLINEHTIFYNNLNNEQKGVNESCPKHYLDESF
jgi:hypothetical protein